MKDTIGTGDGSSVDISGMPISTLGFKEILSDISAKIESGSVGNYISITNTESMYHALRIPSHMDYICGANHSLCDGIGVCIAAYAWGVNVPRRNGPILMLRATEQGQSKGWKHYYYGGKEGVADLLEKKMLEQFPDAKIVGKYCPPFRDLSEDERRFVINDIRESDADIVWVGLGLLKQESWIAEHLSDAGVTWMVGVGAAFDYHAGTVSWAPAWIQALGMEWLYRLILQPRLRGKRYYWSFHFMFQSLFDGVCSQIGKRLNAR